MCGIAGVVDLRRQSLVPLSVLKRMAHALVHRGPDEAGYFLTSGLGLASRRLSIVDLKEGSQPVFNEDGSVVVVYNGELFDHPEHRCRLEARGHRFRSRCDTEILVHLWEEYGEGLFEHLHGQFAFALYDKQQHVLLLARDRMGVCPLHWTRRGDLFYFASEVKSLLATGQVPAEPDLRGIDHVFTFFAMPTRRTPFRGISAILPGHYLKIQFQPSGRVADITEHVYWDFDFPDQGDEWVPSRLSEAAEKLEEVFFRAVELRLRADVPVVGYLSGGVDSAIVLAAASRIRRKPIPSFTVRVDAAGYDESKAARQNAEAIGCPQTVLTCRPADLERNYPKLILAAENPVVDTSCASLYELAAEVHRQGFKVTLTGEGADEAMGGYPWFKTNKLMGRLGVLAPLADAVRRAARPPWVPPEEWGQVSQSLGGQLAQADLYGMVSTARRWFFRQEVLDSFDGRLAYEDLDLDHARMRRWHPFNRSIYVGYKTILPGLLLNQKSDRVAMANSVEARYPFLDEDVVAFFAELHPDWKLRGIFRDKYVLRAMAEPHLPRRATRRPKRMFRAPFRRTLLDGQNLTVSQLLSEESLKKTGYFDPERVRQSMERVGRWGRVPWRRFYEEMGLVAVYATQLWHHVFLGGGLCDLPHFDTSLPTREEDSSGPAPETRPDIPLHHSNQLTP